MHVAFKFSEIMRLSLFERCSVVVVSKLPVDDWRGNRKFAVSPVTSSIVFAGLTVLSFDEMVVCV